MTQNGNFCKEIQVSKIIADAKGDDGVVSLKKLSDFSRVLCSECFAAEQHVNGCFFANIDVFFY